MDTPQKRALVTGAAGGLGRTVAIMLAERGCCVALADRDAQGLEATARSIAALGAETLSLTCDLAEDGAPARTISGVVAAWGGLDVLINNAGYGGIEPFFKMTEALWRKTLDINVVALAMLTSAAGAVMMAPALGSHRQHHLARFPHGVAKLYRLRREQGGGRTRSRARPRWRSRRLACSSTASRLG